MKFCGRKANSGINHAHERALTIVSKKGGLSFEDLSKKDGFFTIYYREIETLSAELFKVKSGLSISKIISNNFEKRNAKL